MQSNRKEIYVCVALDKKKGEKKEELLKSLSSLAILLIFIGLCRRRRGGERIRGANRCVLKHKYMLIWKNR